ERPGAASPDPLTTIRTGLTGASDAAPHELAQLADKLATAEKRIADLERDRESFQRERSLVADSLASAEASMGAAQNQADAARLERDAAIAERDQALEQVAAAEAARADLEAELTELSQQWTVVQAELAEITEQRIAVEAELERLSQARVVSVHDNAALFTRLAEQLDVVERSFGELSLTTESLARGLAQITETKHDLDALLADAAEVEASNETPGDPIAPSSFLDDVDDVGFAAKPATTIPPMPNPPSFDQLPPFDPTGDDAEDAAMIEEVRAPGIITANRAQVALSNAVE
ncbi:MAG: hypothetical protein R2706_18410, partial [Acidimicrobiales bacterium]